MDSVELARMFEYIEENDIHLHRLLIVRNSFLITEAYWHPYGQNDRHSVESITKSIVGTLIGFALSINAIVVNLPQLWVAYREQNLADLSLGTWSLSTSDGLVWIA
jgi:hypothetical protein